MIVHVFTGQSFLLLYTNSDSNVFMVCWPVPALLKSSGVNSASNGARDFEQSAYPLIYYSSLVNVKYGALTSSEATVQL